ncbi:MAG: hypothetical protein HQM08_18865 [Candidatus Riflebacteria bacterium]|nr:hypothetical protein [Candidatus Riflebacteria bacterium]
MYKFTGKRYMTCGVHQEVDLVLQMYLWKLVDDLLRLQPNSVDYLQIFELLPEEKNGILLQKIVHRQEVPPYSKIHQIFILQPIQQKIYIIDDIEHVTMLLSEEY